MKTALYVATVARTYRKAIDDYQKDPELYRKNMPWYLDQISNCTYRQFTTGFFFGKPSEEAQIYDSNTYIREYTYLGITEEIKDGMVKIEQRNKFSVGETIEIMKPNGDNVEVQVKRIVNEEGEEQESAPHPKQVLYVELSGRADKYDILRRKEEAMNKKNVEAICGDRTDPSVRRGYILAFRILLSIILVSGEFQCMRVFLRCWHL